MRRRRKWQSRAPLRKPDETERADCAMPRFSRRPMRLPGRAPTTAELNPSPGRTEHIRPKTGHIWPKTGHIDRQSGHIGRQSEHLSTQASALTPGETPFAPRLPHPSPQNPPLAPRNHIVYTGSTCLPPFPWSPHARPPPPYPIWLRPSVLPHRTFLVTPTPAGGHPRSVRRPWPPEIDDPPEKFANNCLSPARPL